MSIVTAVFVALIVQGISARICTKPYVVPPKLPCYPSATVLASPLLPSPLLPSPLLPSPLLPSPLLPAPLLPSPAACGVVDASLAKSLADTLQFYIVNELMETAMTNPLCVPSNLPYIDPICKTPCDLPQPIDCPMPPLWDLMPLNGLAPVVPKPACGCKKPCSVCNRELILPPAAASLPCGVGYLPGAAPIASAYYGCQDSLSPFCDPYVTGAFPCMDPITYGSGLCGGCCAPFPVPCSRAAIAPPMCPELACLAQPIIL